MFTSGAMAHRLLVRSFHTKLESAPSDVGQGGECSPGGPTTDDVAAIKFSAQDEKPKCNC